MEPINVLVATPAFDRTTPRADEAILKQISQAAHGITVKDGSALIMAEFRGDGAAKEKLDALLADTAGVSSRTLAQLIDARLIRHEAQRRGLVVSSEDIDRAIQEAFRAG